MNICYLHVRISISSGHPVPDIVFQAPCVAVDGSSINSNLLEVREAEDTLAHSGYSPLKPCKRKLEAVSVLNLQDLSDIERTECLLELKGSRNGREIIIETYKSKFYESQLVEEEPKSFTLNPSEKAVKPTVVSTDLNMSKKAEKPVTHKLYKQHKDASEESQSTPKDEKEISEIFEAATSSKTSSRPGSSNDYRPIMSPKHHLKVVPFFCGNPAVEITNGIIHIYKSNSKVSVSEDSTPETDTICLLAVPASIDVQGLMEFTAPFMEVIMQMKVIRDQTPNQYMVLLKFTTPKDACNFFINLNDQPFSSLFPEEICHMAFVASVDSALPYNKDTNTGSAFLPLSDCEELPDCMVCLERMDESVRGLLTILCNHSFHGACLVQWEDMCCPVCRYVQTPEHHSDNKCMVCGGSEDLWICLVCGHVGCGRYTSEHAQRHYLETHHNYAMALSDNRVWDYAGDYFVHRLFQNKEDGKLVEKKGNLSNDENQEAKLEAIQLECMHLLTSQLESQRKYWEEQVARVEKKAETDRKVISSQLLEATEATKELKLTVKDLEKENQSLTHRNKALSRQLYDALKDLQNEREFNKGLVQNQDVWKKKVDALEDRGSKQEEEIRELKEQLRDLMFFIEAEQTIKKSDQSVQEELRGGQLTVAPTPSTSGRRGKGRREK